MYRRIQLSMNAALLGIWILSLVTGCTTAPTAKGWEVVSATIADCDTTPVGGDDCNGQPMNTYYPDLDGDGYGDDASAYEACSSTDPMQGGDCDDSTALISPDAEEVCDGLDNNCDGSVDEGVLLTFYGDADADGYGSEAAAYEACASSDPITATDCDDTDATVHPDASEVCDGIDNDCDGLTDDADDSLDSSTLSIFFTDSDEDGYGDPDAPVLACAPPSGTVSDSTDCDDSTADSSPAASELCDGEDNDCDGIIDNGLLGSAAECEACSCAAILADQPGALDGTYWVAGAERACDMTSNGGGWTQVAEWDRLNDGDSLTDFESMMTIPYNSMSTWQEQSQYLKWCDEDVFGDALYSYVDVDVCNGGEVLWDIQYDGLNYFYNSATWFYVQTASSEENLVCSSTIDEPELYDASALGYQPMYSCPDYDLEIDWDYTDQLTVASDEVTRVLLTSLHHDLDCQDESRLFFFDVWIR